MVMLPDEMIDDTPLPAPRPRRGARATLLAAVVLVSGVAIGVGATMLWKKQAPDAPPPSPNMPPFTASDIAKDMAENHNLSESQRGRVEAALAESLDQMRVIRGDFYEKIGANHEQLREQFKTIMTAEQFQAWSDRFEERRRRWSDPNRRRGTRDWRNGDNRQGQRTPWSSRPKGPRLVRMFDTDEDGKLSAAELPESMRDTLIGADSDGDGLITGDELSLWLGEEITPPAEPGDAPPPPPTP